METSFDPVSGAVLARRRRRLGALVLADRTEPADPAEVAAALARAVAADGLRPLPWTDAARQLQARVALMRRLEPDAGWPDLSDAALTADVPEWLAPQLAGMSRLAELARLDLLAILRGLLPWDLARRLDAALPPQIALPGARAAIDYTQPVPVASARAQAFYGLAATPRLAEGRVPLQFALLSPAGRPVAITADLAGFWRGGWADVRRDMRGRYPKHAWPEDPSARHHDQSRVRRFLLRARSACHLLLAHSILRERTHRHDPLAVGTLDRQGLASVRQRHWLLARSACGGLPVRQRLRGPPTAPSPARRPDSFAPLVKRVLPAVVNIAVTETVSRRRSAARPAAGTARHAARPRVPPPLRQSPRADDGRRVRLHHRSSPA